MQLKLFILPIKNLGAAEAEMNGFLRGHRVLAVKKEFVADGENSFCSGRLTTEDRQVTIPSAPATRKVAETKARQRLAPIELMVICGYA